MLVSKSPHLYRLRNVHTYSRLVRRTCAGLQHLFISFPRPLRPDRPRVGLVRTLLRTGVAVLGAGAFQAAAQTSLLSSAGDFSAGRENFWTYIANDSAQVSFDDEAHYVIEAQQEQPWQIQLLHIGLQMVSGDSYSVCFRARAPQSRSIMVTVDAGGTPNYNVLSGGIQSFLLTDSYADYQYTFTATDSDSTSRLAFNLAGAAGDVYLDDIAVYAGAECETAAPPADGDADGVVDADDLCPDSPPDSIVDADGCELYETLRVEAEDYIGGTDTTSGNEGSPTQCVWSGADVDIEDSTDVGGGCNLGWTSTGETVQYQANVSAGTYRISSRVASAGATGAYNVELGGQVLTDSVGNTGGWQSWETHQLGEVTLPSGAIELNVVILSGSFNLNWLELAFVEPGATDSDGDGVTDENDLCPGTPVDTEVDADGCPVVVEPVDSDGDGVTDESDLCPDTPDGTEVDADGCPVVVAPVDTDGDGVTDESDLCPDTPDGTEVDADGCPVVVEPVDSDGDGVTDENDLCPDTPDGTDVDADGCPEVVAPVDSDGDGVTDENDLCPDTPDGTEVDADGCPVVVEPVDSDGDGVTDENDLCPGTPVDDSVDSEGCSIIENPDGVPQWTGPPPPDEDFQTLPLATGINLPMELDISAAGDLYVIGRLGEFYAFEDGDLVVKSTIETNSFEEGGLIGFALDPNFVTNRFAYFHYTDPELPEHRISRIPLNADNTLDLESESVLLTYGVQQEECCHMGGSMTFDADGNLYISTGDNTSPYESNGYTPIDEQPGRSAFDAQKSSSNTNDLRGKILRITPTVDGGYSIPTGNLFAADALHRPEIYTMGHRNPFRIAIDPETDWLYWAEVGPDANSSSSNRGPAGYDELNRTAAAGNFGWPYFSGANEAYNDYDFDEGESGAKFDPLNVVNDSPNNTGALSLPDAEPAWITMSHRATMIADIYRWNDAVDDSFKLPSYFHGRLIYWNFNNDQVFEVPVDSGSVESRQWLNTSLVDGIIDGRISPQNNRLYMIAYGGNCCQSPPFSGILMEVRYTGGGPETVEPKTYYAVNAGGDAFTSADGIEYEAHGYVDAGSDHASTAPIDGTEDDELYQVQRYFDGDLNFEFPVEDGAYDVVLQFAEHYFDEESERLFDVDIEGQRVITGLDLFTVAGADVAYDRLFTTRVIDGVLNIDLLQDVQNPTIAGIIIRKQGPYPGGSTIVLQSVANGAFVTSTEGVGASTADVNNDAMFEIVSIDTTRVALLSVGTGGYLSVTPSGVVNADAAVVGEAETFQMVENADGSYVLLNEARGDYLAVGSGGALGLNEEIGPAAQFNVSLADVCDPVSGAIGCRSFARPYLKMPVYPAADLGNVPTLLSQTGAYTDAAALELVESFVPYEPAAPFWSDRAVKSRWVSVPSGRKVGYAAEGKWTWPSGTVFVKHFELPVDEADPSVLHRLETRLLIVQPGGSVYGVTYKWREDYSDAELLTEAIDEPINIASPDGDWTQVWSYPAASDCLICHNHEAQGVLGPKTASLNSMLEYPSGIESNQLTVWSAIELLDSTVTTNDLAGLPAHAHIADTSRSLEDRVRSYWDSNCGYCHGPQGIAALWDARFETPLPQQGVVLGELANQRDYFDLYGLVNPFVVDPGNAQNSILFIRDKSVDPDDRMPPLAKNLPDETYLEVLEQWIDSLAE